MFSLRLTHKIAAMAALGVLGLVAVGAIYWAGEAKQAAARKEADDATNARLLTSELHGEMLEARRAEKDFLLRAEESYASRFKTVTAKADELLNRLKTLTSTTGQQLINSEASAIQVGFAAYVEHFNAMATVRRDLGLTEDSGLEGTLRKSVHAIEGLITDPALRIEMLSMRRNEKDFMLRRQDRYVASFKKTAASFAIAVDNAALPEQAKTDIKDKLTAYERDFLAWAARAQSLEVERKSVSASYAAIEPQIDAILSHTAKARDEAVKRSDEIGGATRSGIQIAIALSAIIVGGLALLIGRSISRPIRSMTSAMTVLAGGNTERDIPAQGRGDEIGAMARAVQVFKDNMIRARELEAEAEAATLNAAVQRKRAMTELADQFEKAVGGIVLIVSDAANQLQSSAQSLSAASSQTSHQSTAVAAASEEAAANVRTVAAAAEELSASVREITRQVSDSAQMAQKAVQEAEQTTAQVSGLSASAQKIGAIVDLINDIASKTNLLALNATIEAARAGEAGKGFAVVASEVKALAEQTSRATAEINDHIGVVQISTEEAANAVFGIGKTIYEISHITSTIAAAVEEQGAATEEIAGNVEQAAQGTTEVTRNISGVNQAAEISSTSAGQVLSSATELASQSERLGSEMRKFLANVRAA